MPLRFRGAVNIRNVLIAGKTETNAIARPLRLKSFAPQVQEARF